MGSENWHVSNSKKQAETEHMKIGPLKHPPLAGVCSKFRRMLEVGGGCHPSMRVCCQSFEPLPFEISVVFEQELNNCYWIVKIFRFVTTKVIFTK